MEESLQMLARRKHRPGPYRQASTRPALAGIRHAPLVARVRNDTSSSLVQEEPWFSELGPELGRPASARHQPVQRM